MRFGDEKGVFWLPAPGSDVVRGPGAKPGGKARQPRVHIPYGPEPVSAWVPPTGFPRLSGVVALDWETHDPDLKGFGSNWCRPGTGKTVGFAVSPIDDPGQRWYFPYAHEAGGNLEKEHCLAYLADLAADPSVQFVAHNAMYELGWLWREGIRPVNYPWCTQSAVALLDEYRQRNNQGYNLNAVARDYAGITKDEALLNQAAKHFGLDPKRDLWRLHSKYVGPYAEQDGGACATVWPILRKLLEAEDLWNLFLLEMRYSVVCTAMRWRGIRVNTSRAEQFRDELVVKEAEAAKQLKLLAGFEVPIWEAAVIAKAFDKFDIPYVKNSRGGSFTAGFLDSIDHPIPKNILIKRRLEKVRSTFVEGFFLNLQHNGRIYSQTNPLPTDDAGTVSGRSSSERPNVRQLSAKNKEMARHVRGMLLPEEGARWAAMDINQQEPRIAVHFAYLAGVLGARAVVEMYRANPKIDFHQMVADLGAIKRSPAKIINLAMMYGKGEAALCHELGFETEWIQTRNGMREVAGPEGKAFIAKYHKLVPWLSGLKEKCALAVRLKGHIRTILGRRCRFGEGKGKEHMAVNRLVQGSAADQIKQAVVNMYEQEGEIPLVEVYDEIGVNKTSDEQIGKLVQIMKDATPLEVPVVVDVAEGNDWGEAL